MILHSESWHSQKSLFKHFQGCLGIFKDTDAYLATLTDKGVKWREGGVHIFLLERGENLKRAGGVDVKMGGCHFFIT